MTETKTTVAELIEKLKKCNPNDRVVIPFGDSGFNDVNDIVIDTIALNINNSRYKGKHGFQEDATRKTCSMQFENVLIIK